MNDAELLASLSITEEEAEANRRYLQGLRERHAWTLKLRPAELGDFAGRLVWPTDRRRIVATETGTLLYVDPFTHGGMTVIHDRRYDPEAEDHLMELLTPGGRCLDIGANEGILSALMARQVGEGGYVACVEPQSRLQDIIRINVRINSDCRFRLYRNVVGGIPGDAIDIHLFPIQNTGSTGIHRSSRLGRATEKATFVDPTHLFEHAPDGGFDVVKVDVEGAEDTVARSLKPFLAQGRVGALLMEYHDFILRDRGIDADRIDEEVRDSGMAAVSVPPQTEKSFTRLALYRRSD